MRRATAGISMVPTLCLIGCMAASHQSDAGSSLILDSGPWHVVLDQGVILELMHRPTNQRWVAGSGSGQLAGLRALSGEGIEFGTAEKTEVSENEVILHGNGAELGTAVRCEGEDLLITQRGHREARGLVSVRWGIVGGPIKDCDIILPHQGGMRVPAAELYFPVSAEYPGAWESPLVILESRGRGLAVWAEDPAFRFKSFTVMCRKGQLALSFETQNWAPFEDRADLAPTTWRLSAFRGDWRTAARRYRRVMERLLHPPRPADFAPWAAGINFVLWIYPCDLAHYLDVLRELATQVDPRKTLLIAVCSRQSGYDSNYPDYTPWPDVAEFTREAQRMGYHVAAWASFPGVSPHHPLYQSVKACQYRQPFTKALLGWHWAEQDAVCHAFINPSSSAFRHALTEALVGYHGAVGMESLHLDVSAPIWNDANGLIDGHTVVEGHRMLHRELAQSLPGVVFSGESLHEITLGHGSFAQRWRNGLIGGRPHPISAFLFHEFTRGYGYCMPKPGEYFEGLNRLYEGWGVLPTLRVDTVEELRQPAAQRVVRLARVFQQHDLQPDFTLAWKPGTKFRWRGRDGITALCRCVPSGVVFECGGETLYRRIEGVNIVVAAGSLPGWYAYDERQLFGLDPATWHYLDPTPRSLRTAHVSSLPKGVVAHDFQLSETALSFGLRTLSPQPLFSFREHVEEARTGVVREGHETAMDDALGASFMPHSISVGGVTRNVLYARPAWKRGPGDAFGEFEVTVPDDPAIGLDFAAGLMDGAKGSDGVTFIITVNGRELFREHILPGSWQERRVPLESYRCSKVKIRFTTNPGPKNNTTDDWAGWANPCLTVRPSAARTRIEVLVPGLLRALTTGDRAGSARVSRPRRQRDRQVSNVDGDLRSAVSASVQETPMRVYRIEATLPTSVKVEWTRPG